MGVQTFVPHNFAFLSGAAMAALLCQAHAAADSHAERCLALPSEEIGNAEFGEHGGKMPPCTWGGPQGQAQAPQFLQNFGTPPALEGFVPVVFVMPSPILFQVPWVPQPCPPETLQPQRSMACLCEEKSESSTQAGSGCSSPRDARSSCRSNSPEANDCEKEAQTTVVIRNMPLSYTREMICELLDEAGFETRYDFIYQPTDFRTWMPFGYAFVNLVSPEDAQQVMSCLEGFDAWKHEGGKPCQVVWSFPYQGLAANVEKYRNSPVMSETVHDKFKPALFKDGARMRFPTPTRKPRVPRVRRASHSKLREEVDRVLASSKELEGAQ